MGSDEFAVQLDEKTFNPIKEGLPMKNSLILPICQSGIALFTCDGNFRH
jgi:hypothetical protein